MSEVLPEELFQLQDHGIPFYIRDNVAANRVYQQRVNNQEAQYIQHQRDYREVDRGEMRNQEAQDYQLDQIVRENPLVQDMDAAGYALDQDNDWEQHYEQMDPEEIVAEMRVAEEQIDIFEELYQALNQLDEEDAWERHQAGIDVQNDENILNPNEIDEENEFLFNMTVDCLLRVQRTYF